MPTIDGKFIGEKVLEEGAFLFHNCFKFYLDKELRYPVRLSLNDILPNVQFEHASLLSILPNLEEGESFSWVLYAQYIHPNGDTITALEIVPPKEMDFIIVKVSKQNLKSGDKFKLLFTFTQNSSVDAYFNNPKSDATFGIHGKAQRMIMS